jgi:hypothetical protein
MECVSSYRMSMPIPHSRGGFRAMSSLPAIKWANSFKALPAARARDSRSERNSTRAA